jgi:hypothetical protein
MGNIPNEELVQKATIVADDLAAAGKLNPAQSDKFIDYVIDETVLKNNARVVRFRNESLDIDKIGIGARAAVPKAEAVDPGVRRGINTSKVTLTPSEIMVPFEIGDIFREINIEGDSVEEHIIKMFATQFANDIEELYLLGNKLGPAVLESEILDGGSTTGYVKDSYLALQNGWNLLADGGHVVDAEGANIGLSIFGKAIRAMPTKFRRNKKALRFFSSPDLAQLYMEKLSTRATSLGDSAAGGEGIAPFGVQVVEAPLQPFQPGVTEHTSLAAASTFSLKNAPVSNVVVTPQSLASTPTVPYIEDTDYSVDYANGTITNLDAGIGDGDPIKITYDANPQLILTHQNNFIVGIGRDISIEKDRDIFKGVNQYAITARVAVEFEEDDAIVKVRNIGTGV